MKNENTIKSFKIICAILASLALFLMIAHLVYRNNIKVYTFGGYNDDVTILDGTIVTTNKINRFSAPNVILSRDDIILTEYEIGYYIDGNEISVVRKSKDDEVAKVKLTSILENSEFSFTETKGDAMFLSQTNIKKIKKLEFKILGIDEKGHQIEIVVPLDVNSLS